jgi:DNA-binding CsgD family transcriptional regulator
MLLVDVAQRGDIASLMTAVRDALRSWVGVGPVFLATSDPVTGSFTSTFTFDIPDEAAAGFFAIEMAGGDVVSFKALAASRRPFGSLYEATATEPELSERWRQVIAPLGWGDELRAAVRLHRSVWGYLCVHREAGERPFGPRELAQLHALLPAIGAAMRTATVAGRGFSEELSSGVVVVDERGRLAGLTGAAEAWLDELGPRPRDGLPLLLAALTRQAFDTAWPITSTISTRTGRVGVVEAAQLQGGGGPQVAVVISPAPVRYQLDRLAAASALTGREQEIVSCLLIGMSTRAIADRLSISPYTVQAHLTSVFTKTGLRSRRELVSRLSR